MRRPTHKELDGKIQQAKRAVLQNRLFIVNPDVLVVDIAKIGYAMDELGEFLSKTLDEVTADHYAGANPPQKSYEPRINHLELFAFHWSSAYLGCRLYFKFAIKKGDLWIVSLHRDHPEHGKQVFA